MPSTSRSEVINPREVGVYHAWSRCVRQAFLCGKDDHSGKDYEYRRDWIVDYQRELAALFAIEISFRGELANHLHLVLRNRPDIVATWSDEEVARRWLTIANITKSKDGQPVEISPIDIRLEIADPERVEELRLRLAHPSYFMAALGEHVGRRANREDGTTGCFWDGRFRCKNLADEAAILVCGVYIDLNQIRAGEAISPETSRHTSAYDRIQAKRQRAQRQHAVGDPRKPCDSTAPSRLSDDWLCELTLQEGLQADPEAGVRSATGHRASDKGILPVTLDNYLELLDATGRAVREGKGAIPAHLSPILERLGINTTHWTDVVQNFDKLFGTVVGASERVLNHARKTGRAWIHGQAMCKAVFG